MRAQQQAMHSWAVQHRHTTDRTGEVFACSVYHRRSGTWHAVNSIEAVERYLCAVPRSYSESREDTSLQIILLECKLVQHGRLAASRR